MLEATSITIAKKVSRALGLDANIVLLCTGDNLVGTAKKKLKALKADTSRKPVLTYPMMALHRSGVQLDTRMRYTLGQAGMYIADPADVLYKLQYLSVALTYECSIVCADRADKRKVEQNWLWFITSEDLEIELKVNIGNEANGYTEVPFPIRIQPASVNDTEITATKEFDFDSGLKYRFDFAFTVNSFIIKTGMSSEIKEINFTLFGKDSILGIDSAQWETETITE